MRLYTYSLKKALDGRSGPQCSWCRIPALPQHPNALSDIRVRSWSQLLKEPRERKAHRRYLRSNGSLPARIRRRYQVALARRSFAYRLGAEESATQVSHIICECDRRKLTDDSELKKFMTVEECNRLLQSNTDHCLSRAVVVLQ